MASIADKLVGLHGAATTAAPAGYRSHLVGGSAFARDCAMVVAYFAGLGDKPARPPAGCASAPVWSFGVAVVKDCYPVTRDRKLPPPAVVDAWVVEWMELLVAVSGALYSWVDTDALNQGYDCSAWTFAPVIPSGPRGGCVTATWTLSFTDDTAGITTP